jgi:hypothetical protein
MTSDRIGFLQPRIAPIDPDRDWDETVCLLKKAGRFFVGAQS